MHTAATPPDIPTTCPPCYSSDSPHPQTLGGNTQPLLEDHVKHNMGNCLKEFFIDYT